MTNKIHFMKSSIKSNHKTHFKVSPSSTMSLFNKSNGEITSPLPKSISNIKSLYQIHSLSLPHHLANKDKIKLIEFLKILIQISKIKTLLSHFSIKLIGMLKMLSLNTIKIQNGKINMQIRFPILIKKNAQNRFLIINRLIMLDFLYNFYLYP